MHSQAIESSEPAIVLGESEKRVAILVSVTSGGVGDIATVFFSGIAVKFNSPFAVPSGHPVWFRKSELGDGLTSTININGIDNSGTLSTFVTVMEVLEE